MCGIAQTYLLETGSAAWVISPKISGVQKWNFLGIISEEILNEE
jgi:hypothetical protein